MTRNAKRLPVSGLIALVLWLGPASLAQVSDLAPPVLVGFDFSPRTVDTTTGPQTVTVTWHVSDDLSGVNGGCVTFGHGVGGCFNDPVDRISGTDHDGVYQGHLEVPQYAENGTWTIESFSVSDKVGNLIQPSVAELAASGFPTVLVVTGPADTAPPVLVGFDFSPRTVDTTTGSQTVMVTWHVTDDVAGVFGGCVTFGHGVGGCFNDPVDRISGTDHDGVYQGHFEVPRYAPNGTWTIESFSVSDKVSHQIRPTIAELVAQGFPTQLAVTGPEDTTPPVLVGFDFSPRVVDISAGPQTVTLVWHLTDNLAGILGSCVRFVSPFGHDEGGCFNDPVNRVSGTDTDGVYQNHLVIPQFAETGTWTIGDFVVYDKAENQVLLSASDLEDMGLPSRLRVGPGPCDLQTTCDDGSTCTDDSCDFDTGCVHTWNGTCVSQPRTAGYYKKLCNHPHSNERLTQTDVDCVSQACPFTAIASVDDVCAVLNKDWPADSPTCDAAAMELMALTLNVCRSAIGVSQAIDPACTNYATVGEALADARGFLCDGAEVRIGCEQARCESKEINSGKALRVDSLRLERLASGEIRLAWDPLYVDSDDPAPLRYRVWRRAGDFEPFIQVGETEDLSFVDTPGAESLHEYQVTPVR